MTGTTGMTTNDYGSLRRQGMTGMSTEDTMTRIIKHNYG